MPLLQGESFYQPRTRFLRQATPLAASSMEAAWWILKASFAQIRSWISNCRRRHQKCCSSMKHRVSSCRVIDCRTRRIVPLTSKMDYLTLSYVWGAQAETNNTIPSHQVSLDHMPVSAPKTIKDAMFVVCSLKMRYLWVDRYCIPN